MSEAEIAEMREILAELVKCYHVPEYLRDRGAELLEATE